MKKKTTHTEMVDSKAKKNVQNRNEKNLYIQEWYIQKKNVYGMEMKKKTT